MNQREEREAVTWNLYPLKIATFYTTFIKKRKKKKERKLIFCKYCSYIELFFVNTDHCMYDK